MALNDVSQTPKFNPGRVPLPNKVKTKQKPPAQTPAHELLSLLNKLLISRQLGTNFIAWMNKTVLKGGKKGFRVDDDFCEGFAKILNVSDRYIKPENVRAIFGVEKDGYITVSSLIHRLKSLTPQILARKSLLREGLLSFFRAKAINWIKMSPNQFNNLNIFELAKKSLLHGLYGAYRNGLEFAYRAYAMENKDEAEGIAEFLSELRNTEDKDLEGLSIDKEKIREYFTAYYMARLDYQLIIARPDGKEFDIDTDMDFKKPENVASYLKLLLHFAENNDLPPSLKEYSVGALNKWAKASKVRIREESKIPPENRMPLPYGNA